MLLQFRFKNYKSFKDETILDMMATPIKELNNHLIDVNGNKILPVASVFGANASGKSNLFLALNKMRNLVISSKDENSESFMKNSPFIFNSDSRKQATEFEVSIYCKEDQKEYRYGFTIGNDGIEEEWLFNKLFKKNTTAKENCIFYRNKSKVTIGKVNEKNRKELKYISEMIDNKLLIMTEIGKRKKSNYSFIHYWFCIVFMVDFADERQERLFQNQIVQMLETNPKNKEKIMMFLHEFDEAIVDLKVRKILNQDLEEKYSLFSVHKMDDDNAVEIPFESESNGTRKIFVIAFMILMILEHGGVCFFDELDTKLHPLILRKILHLFVDKETNKGNAQLVFSSHNLVCLDSSDLRRDEIWFVEKNNQISTLYSLYDFKENQSTIRSDLSFGKHYLNGRFGAVPFQKG